MKSNKKAEGKVVGIVIAAFLMILIGVIVVNIVAEQSLDKTTLKSATENISIAAARAANNSLNSSVWLHFTTQTCPSTSGDWRGENGCSISNVVVYNQSYSVLTTGDYTLNTSCNSKTGTASGDIALKNTTSWRGDGGAISEISATANTTQITYSYCDSEYVAQSWGRTILNLVPGLFVLGIFCASAFLLFKVMKAEGENLEG